MRVLVIEDFEQLRDSVCQGLHEAGFAVDAASDGTIGLWQAQSGHYDVIILDLMLPGIAGLDLLRTLRTKAVGSHVLILIAKDAPPDRIRGLDAGADDYLVKPFEFGELLARVRALVRRLYKTKNPVITVANLEIDTTTRTVQRAGKVIELTPREYAVLEFMALRQGQIVTRADLWEHVYEFTSEASSNVVDVFIGHLRRKIDVPETFALIHTRRGHGYVLGVTP